MIFRRKVEPDDVVKMLIRVFRTENFHLEAFSS